MACANLPYMKPIPDDHMSDARKNIEWLKKWGVVSYQIDSDYDLFFRQEK